MGASAIMFQGTGSDVGKSLIVAGLCRAFHRRGLFVRPFKPQNMSNNAAVTPEGAEIGRAQALQARAAGVAPSSDMNPVLLKPESERGAQVIVGGRMWATLSARDYGCRKAELLPAVLAAFERLSKEADLVLVEGAGSPAEVNLRAGDIANMGFAEAADLPVVLIGDIDRGGVIASLVGTVDLLPDAERDRIKGFIINKFRGDPRLFDEGLGIIEARGGFASLGVVPYFAAAGRLPAEDSVSLGDGHAEESESRTIKIAIPRLPRIANFDDFDPLIAEPEVSVVFVPRGEALPGDADLVILPGSKATLSDLAALRAEGWDIDLVAHLRRGGQVLGICGGYQMLGRQVADPDGIEGPPESTAGLGHLDIETVLTGDKRLQQVEGRARPGGQTVRGYEIHIGLTQGPDCARPMLELAGRPDGASSADGKIMGCYLHGLFAADDFRRAFLDGLAARERHGPAYEQGIETTLDALANHLEAHLDLDRLLRIGRLGT
jgi:adenosylcobyric acid synthase